MKTRIEKRRPIIYIEIKEILKKKILSGRLNLLSESKIIHQFKVSSTTARRVLNDLEEWGMMSRGEEKYSPLTSFDNFQRTRIKFKELVVLLFDNLVHPARETGNP